MKRLSLVLSFILMFGLSCRGQLILGKLGTDLLVEDALKGGFIIVHTQYQLKAKASGNLYGRGGRDYYGETYSLGYLFPQGCIVPYSTLNPWENDPYFEKYRGNDSYQPVLTDTATYISCGKDATLQSFVMSNITAISDSAFFIVPTEPDEGKALPVTQEEGELTGWFLWCMIPKGQNLGTDSALSYTSIYRKINTTDPTTLYVDAPIREENPLGGIFVVPHVDSVGKISLLTKGILQKTDDGSWYLYFCSKEPNQSAGKHEESEKIGTAEKNDDGLTLVASGEKKKRTKDKK